MINKLLEFLFTFCYRAIEYTKENSQYLKKQQRQKDFSLLSIKIIQIPEASNTKD